MRTLIAVVLPLALAVGELRARAEEAPPATPPPTEQPQQQPQPQPAPDLSQPAPPPGYYVPPQPPPGYVFVSPPAAQLAALEAAGRHKKLAGAILMGSGAGLVLIGSALWIAGAWSQDDACVQANRANTFPNGDHGCENGALVAAGAGTALFGTAVLITGVPVYIIGGSQIARAYQLRRTVWIAPAARPVSSGHGGLGGLALTF
jgi:hypothetical protein